MKPAGWAVVAVAAMIAAVAWRFARRSKLALAIALLGTTLAGCGLAFAAGGWSGCSDRGDCGPVGGTLRAILIVETLLLPLLLVSAGARALWRRFVPAREPRERRPRARGDARRMRLRDVGLALGGVGFGLFGVVMLVTARGHDRISGLTVLVFALAILLVPLSGRLAARSGLRPRLERVERDGELQPALVIPGSRAKLRLMTLACLCFAGMGVLMAIWPDALSSSRWSPGAVRTGGILCALLFGVVGVSGMLLSRGPVRIELLPGGLRWQVGTAPSFAAWDAITGAGAYEIRNTWFLGLQAEASGLYIPSRQRWLARANRAISGVDASVALEAFPVEPERLAEVVASCAQDAQRRSRIGTDASLAWLQEAAPPPSPAPPLPVG
jgi:hypothetical protein